MALFDLLNVLGSIGVIIAVITYFGTEKQRREAEISIAWQTITNASGQGGNGGRIRSLQFLNASPGANWRRRFPWICPERMVGLSEKLPICFWPRESLARLDLSLGDVEDADEDRASGTGAFLAEIHLPNAYLEGSNLTDAFLGSADLTNANLEGDDLTDANLGRADLTDAYLGEANLTDANLKGADLTDATLRGATLDRSILLAADLTTSIDLTDSQLSAAFLCATKLPPAINLDPDRDCDQLPQILVENYPDSSLEEAKEHINRIRSNQ